MFPPGTLRTWAAAGIRSVPDCQRPGVFLGCSRRLPRHEPPGDGVVFRYLETGTLLMTTTNGTDSDPLWLSIEKKILELGSHDLAEDNLENAIQGLGKSLDGEGLNVSRNAGRMLELRRAVAARVSVGHPLMEDLNKTFDALTLDDLGDTYSATLDLIEEAGDTWPALKEAERRSHILRIVEGIKLDLLVAKAKEIGGDGGVRLLIEREIPAETVVDRLEITQEEYDGVLAAVEAERAERARAAGLLQEVDGKSEEDRVRHLINSDVAEDLILEMAGVDQAAIDAVNKAMEEEIAEKKRLAEEEAARKKAEAEGPALEDIPADEMLEHIEAIREILEFSDVEQEIRVMCEQSSVPKALVDVVVSDPDKLDELEAEAEG